MRRSMGVEPRAHLVPHSLPPLPLSLILPCRTFGNQRVGGLVVVAGWKPAEIPFVVL